MIQYGKLCTEFYDIDKPEPPADALAFYRAHAESAHGPILEPMCGSGRYLVPLLAAGFDCEGTDASAPMLEACRARAGALGIVPRLHHQRLEALELDRTFGLIIIPTGSFSLLTDPAAVERSLSRLHAALLPGGRLLVEVEGPTELRPSQSGTWGGRWVQRPDGSKIILSWLGTYSGVERISRAVHRYELVQDGRLVATEFEDFELRFYEVEEFTALLRRAGFARIHAEPSPDQSDDVAYVFTCERA